jgi:hypothetical protein
LRRVITETIWAFRDKDGGTFKPDAKIESWQVSLIKSSIEVFEHQFSAELKKMVIYAVPRRGIFDTERLVASAEGHLPQSIRDDLSSFVIRSSGPPVDALHSGCFRQPVFTRCGLPGAR